MLALLFCAVSPADANTGIIERVMRQLEVMEFEFARSESNVPFLPVVHASFKVYGETSFEQFEGLPAAEEEASFRTRVTSAYAMAPLYIGRNGLAVAVPSVSSTRFHFTAGDRQDGHVTALYLPVAAAWETDSGQQWGAFIMPSSYSPLSGEGDWAWSGMAGVMGRTFSGRHVVWYYGMVYDHAFANGYFLPYAGFTYQLNRSLAFSMVAPWPGINYAPSDRFYARLGIAPSGATWAVRDEEGGDDVLTAFGGWDFGLWGNWRLSQSTWCSLGAGVSGLRSLRITSGGELDYEQDVDREPWISISLSIVPP
jgi:hypothetical protein